MKDHTSKDKRLEGSNFEPSNNAEESNKEKNKKRKWQQKKESNTPLTNVNAEPTSNTENLKKWKRGAPKKDLSKITCYNCDKKGHYSNKCPDLLKLSQKTSIGLGDLLVDDW